MDTGGPPSTDLANEHELALARLSVATDAAQLGLWDWDLTTDALVWDHRSRAMYGQLEMPLTGLVADINRTIHPDDQGWLATELGRCIDTKGSLEVEFRIVWPDGSERVVNARGQVLVDADGNAVRMIGTNADVTDSRRTQRQATQDARRMAALVAVAQALGDADTEDDVLGVVKRTASDLLAADVAALVLLTPGSTPGHGTVRTLTVNVAEDFAALVAELPADLPTPAVATIATGEPVLVNSRAEAPPHLADDPLWQAAGVEAVAVVPLADGQRTFGSLTIALRAPTAWREADHQLMDALGALTAQALRRLWARDAEVSATRAAQRSAAQQAALVALASSLELAGSEEEVLAVVTGGGVSMLGARGTVLCLRDGDVVRALTTQSFDERVQAEVAELPSEFPLPMVLSAVAGSSLYLDDVDAAVALFPGGPGEETTRPLYASAGTVASAAVPLTAEGAVVGSLSFAFDGPRTWLPAERQLLGAFAALAAQALERIRAREAEEAANAAVRRFSETLQRSLLTSPPQADHLLIAVRYLPAAAEAQVGGDWYDAFVSPDGAMHLVVGDVTGHDRDAAAAMGQMRNLLRGITHVTGAGPAQVLSSLDAAVLDLDVGAMATVVLARVEQDGELVARGARRLRWSNAGHPPPLLLRPDGAAEFLEHDTDLLVGLMPEADRSDHEVVLEPGDTLLVYTDGLVERRGATLQQGLDWLAGAVSAAGDLTPDELCDELLRQVGSRVEDDVAMVALRAHPQDEPRPPQPSQR